MAHTKKDKDKANEDKFDPNKPGELKASIRSLSAELDSEFVALLGSEVGELQRIAKFTESVTKKIKKHYSEIFPKKCNSCGTIYKSREEYLKATHSLKNGDTVFDEAGLQEYRNCPCGSTLILWTKDRRDHSDYGIARRKLYDECLEKLKKLSNEPEEQLRVKLRGIFSMLSS